jgi:hypothetical protein
MNKNHDRTNEEFIADYEQQTEGLKHVNVGLASCCEECCRSWGMEEEAMRAGLENDEICDEGGFSWSSCDTCGSVLGGMRYAGHAWIAVEGKPDELIHLEVCTDCLCYIANGDLPNP